MKILTVLGARPQFIKAGPVSRQIRNLQKEGENIQEVIVHTGQHYDKNMSDIFFEKLHLPKPDYFLGIGGKSHGEITGKMIIKLEEVMLKEKPDIVLVYGNTNSTLAGAIAAAKLHIPIAHVEAGLRSFNMKMPEEINRILTDRVSAWLFCPTDKAVKNLKKAGFMSGLKGFGKVIKVGNVMYDAVLYYKRFARKPNIEIELDKEFILCTIYRQKNIDNSERLKNILVNKMKIVLFISSFFYPQNRMSTIRLGEWVMYLAKFWYDVIVVITKNILLWDLILLGRFLNRV